MISDSSKIPPDIGVPGTGWLCGFVLAPSSDEPDLFVILLEDRNSGWPVLSQGRIVLFTRLELARRALSMDDDPLLRRARLPHPKLDQTYVFDLGEVIAVLHTAEADMNALIVNFLNLLLDLVNASGVPMPVGYRRALHHLANEMTFSRDLATFFAMRGHSRATTINAIYWSLGAVLSRAILLR